MTQGREMHIVTRVAAHSPVGRVVSVRSEAPFPRRDPLGCANSSKLVPYDYRPSRGPIGPSQSARIASLPFTVSTGVILRPNYPFFHQIMFFSSLAIICGSLLLTSAKKGLSFPRFMILITKFYCSPLVTQLAPPHRPR